VTVNLTSSLTPGVGHLIVPSGTTTADDPMSWIEEVMADTGNTGLKAAGPSPTLVSRGRREVVTVIQVRTIIQVMTGTGLVAAAEGDTTPRLPEVGGVMLGAEASGQLGMMAAGVTSVSIVVTPPGREGGRQRTAGPGSAAAAGVGVGVGVATVGAQRVDNTRCLSDVAAIGTGAPLAVTVTAGRAAPAAAAGAVAVPANSTVLTVVTIARTTDGLTLFQHVCQCIH